MRLWFRYFAEKRTALLLYAVTVLLFVAVGSLYHIDNLEKLMYAALLTFVVWSAVGFLGGLKYVRKSRLLEEEAVHFEQAGELRAGIWDRDTEDVEARMEDAGTMEEAYRIFISMICEEHGARQNRWERHSAECRDYYLAWTHQIKTPISAMKLLLEGREFHGKESFLMREELFKIEQYAEMVLTFQRLPGIAADLVLQEYDLYSLVKQAVKKYSILFINKGLKLELPEMHQSVVTDEKWFVFCMEQLLSNSIKYTVEGRISIVAEDGGDKVILRMKDTGMGIRAEDLPRIFERGFTGYNGRLDKKSTGIGLYLCKRIFGHLGIAVKVESEEGKGTRVILGIPGSGRQDVGREA